jgi:alkylated DNA nucleotide flippase Atl1
LERVELRDRVLASPGQLAESPFSGRRSLPIESKGIPMVSSRAAEVAELLYELKRAQKIATYSSLAKQAGFSAGMNGRTMATTIRTIRRDWPHLEWWRAIGDDGLLDKDSEHEAKLRQGGFELEEPKGKRGMLTVKSLDKHLMTWNEVAAEVTTTE